MSVATLAGDHQARIIGITDTLTARALRLWSQVGTDDLDAGWNQVAPAMVQQTQAAQLAAAKTSDRYVSRLSATTGFDQEPSSLIPQSFVGIDGSGRDVEGLLHGAVTTTKQSIGAGLGLAQSFESGAVYLAAMLKTAMADIGRSADMTSATGKGYTQYVRVISPGACSRCAILAGISSYKIAFKRHPACHCTAAPIAEKSDAGALFQDTQAYFDSLSREEQNRTFTQAGAEAIRAGADPVKVVSARRGARGISYSHVIGEKELRGTDRRLTRSVIGRRTDGTPVYGYTTTEGTTSRGQFAKQSTRTGGELVKVGNDRYRTVKRIRLMPETIVSLTDDPELRRVLLRDAGYLDQPLNYKGDWITQRAQLEMQDHQRAEAFYRSLGISL